MFTDIYHVGYLTDDIDAASRFYEKTFGGSVKNQITTPEGTKMAFLRVGRTEVELIEPPDKTRLGGKTGLVLDHIG